MTRTTTTTCLVFACALLAGCSKKQQVTTPTAPAEPPVAQKAEPPPAPPPAPQTTPNVAVSDELARQCQLKLDNRQEAPKFDLDRAELLPEDRAVLEQIAACLTTGPLAGKSLQLTGHADPRGTDEYNLALGARRADTVGAYLERLGVPARQLQKTTRGELDAAGSNEASWRVDRRVDLKLAEPRQTTASGT